MAGCSKCPAIFYCSILKQIIMAKQQSKAVQPLTAAQKKKIMGGAAAAKYLCADRISHVFRCYATKSLCLAGCPTPSACTPSTLCV
jgi:hypothetical protein